MFKLCASPINTFVQQHCEINNFVNTEQGGKQGVWGCLEQLLINKTEWSKWGKTKSPKSSHCMARLLESIWLSPSQMVDQIFKTW